MATQSSERPNGPVAAVLLAGGIGAAVLGLVTLAFEFNDKSAFASWLTWYKPVGGLSGKSGLAIIAFLVSWLVLHFILKDRETRFGTMAVIALVGLAIGLVGTFPPIWHLLFG